MKDTKYIVAYALLAIYAAPIILLWASFFYSNQFENLDLLLKWLLSFATSQENTLNEVHNLLLPVLVGLSILSHDPTDSKRNFWILSAITFSLFVVTIALQVATDIESVSKNIRTHPDYEKLTGNPFSSFLDRIRGLLLLYLAVLFGLNQKKKG